MQIPRARFPVNQSLVAGRLVRLQMRSGRIRVIRIVEVGERTVTVDTNHPRCGQSVELEAEVVAVGEPEPEVGHWRL